MWFEFHDSLPDDPKVQEMAEILDLPDTQIIGMLGCLWSWAINQRQDGYLAAVDWRPAERAARWSGTPRALFDALLTVHFLDTVGEGYAFHNWKRYAGKLIERREKDRARKSDGKPSESSRSYATVPQEFHRNSNGIPPENARSTNGIPDATVTLTVTQPFTDDVERAPAREEPVEVPPELEESKIHAYDHYGKTIGLLTPRISEAIGSYLDDGFEDALICEAMDQAVAQGVRKWAYVNAILDNCARDNVLTLAKFQALQVEREAAKARAAPPGRGDIKGVKGDKSDANEPVRLAAPNDDLRQQYGI